MEEHKDNEIGALEAIAGSSPQNPDRRQFLISTLFGATLPSLIMPSEAYAQRRRAARLAQRRPAPQPRHAHRDYSAIRDALKLGYSEIVPEPNLRGVRLEDMNENEGRVQRVLRWENICQAVGQRYGIPHTYLLGMICVESEGDPTQPNDLGDGGVGLIHMQPLLTSAYGLKMITDSKRLRDFTQGRKINGAIDATNADLKDLIKYDDRFHPIKNIDAAARMIADHFESTHSWSKALEKYAGRGSYDSKVLGYSGRIGNPAYRRQIARDFNERNSGFSVGGRPMTFDRYLATFHGLNRNYGLDAYRKFRAAKVV